MAGCISELYSTFLPTFQFMEDKIILNIEIEAHLFCLHYVFLPHINRALDLFAGT